MDLLKNYISEVFLSEAQRYKVDRFKIIEKYKNDPWVFFRYTTINKLGVNPNFRFGALFGIYAYPIRIFNENIPFKGANNPNFIHIFSVKQEYRDKIIILSQNCESNKDIEIDQNSEYYTSASDMIDKILDQRYGIPLSPFRQSKEIMKLGYYGIINNGCDLIHPDIPNEAIFFSKESIEHLETIDITKHNKKPYERIVDYIDSKDKNKIMNIILKGSDEEKVKFLQIMSDQELSYEPYWQKYINMLYKDPYKNVRWWVASLTRDKKILNILSEDPDQQIRLTASERFIRSAKW